MRALHVGRQVQMRCAQCIGEESLTAHEMRASQIGAHDSSRSARTSTPGAQFIGEVRMTAREMCAPQFGAHLTAREVRALQLQARYYISDICGACITVRKVRAPQFPARSSLVRCAWQLAKCAHLNLGRVWTCQPDLSNLSKIPTINVHVVLNPIRWPGPRREGHSTRN